MLDSVPQIYSNESSQSSSSTTMYHMDYSPLRIENESNDELEEIIERENKVLFNFIINCGLIPHLFISKIQNTINI